MDKIKKTIELIDKMLILSKDKIKLYNRLKLGLYIKAIKDGNDTCLVMKFKDYVNDLRNISVHYLLDRTTIHFLIKSIEPEKYKKHHLSAIRFFPNDTYIAIGNKNKQYIIIQGIELDEDKFVMKVE